MNTILEVENCSICYKNQVEAVKDVSFTVGEREIVTIVGESGSGKTTLIRAILGILPPGGRVTSGRLLFRDRDLAQAREEEMQRIRGTEIAMIFQDVGASLDPIRRIDGQYVESIRVHQRMKRRDALGIGRGISSGC